MLLQLRNAANILAACGNAQMETFIGNEQRLNELTLLQCVGRTNAKRIRTLSVNEEIRRSENNSRIGARSYVFGESAIQFAFDQNVKRISAFIHRYFTVCVPCSSLGNDLIVNTRPRYKDDHERGSKINTGTIQL